MDESQVFATVFRTGRWVHACDQYAFEECGGPVAQRSRKFTKMVVSCRSTVTLRRSPGAANLDFAAAIGLRDWRSAGLVLRCFAFSARLSPGQAARLKGSWRCPEPAPGWSYLVRAPDERRIRHAASRRPS